MKSKTFLKRQIMAKASMIVPSRLFSGQLGKQETVLISTALTEDTPRLFSYKRTTLYREGEVYTRSDWNYSEEWPSVDAYVSRAKAKGFTTKRRRGQ